MRLALVVLALGLCGNVVADPKKPVDAVSMKKANNHFKLGQEFFKNGQWDRAITEYQDALELTGEPLLVFNIALAHDRAGRAEEALAGYLKYLDQGPDGPIADEARGYVAKLTPLVEKRRKEREADAAKQAAVAKQAQDAANQQAEAVRQAATAKQVVAARAEHADAVDRRGRLERWGGIGVAGVGAVVFGVGIKRGLDARSISNELSTHQGAWTDAEIARDADGRSDNKQMKVLTALGVATVVGGGVLYLIGRTTHHHAEQLRVGAMPARGGGALAFAVSF